ncbi:ABC transporter permease [ANME-1 cluster archaeon AG-394-G21]|nr:ABC transporter permease [ANME-1 cluster archaeon AG-394-G21]
MMRELFALASRQLGRKKLRVFLIVLGIAIGVAAVIGVTSLGEGIRVQAVEQIKSQHDLTTIEVSAGVGEGIITLITDSKLNAIETDEHVLFLAPFVKDSYVTQNNTYLAVKGITAEYKRIHSDLQLERGAWFEAGKKSNEIVLGYDVAKRLSTIEDLELGDRFNAKIRLYGEGDRPTDKTTTFIIAGILKSAGDEHDNQVLVGLTEAKALDEKDAYDGALVKVDDPASAASVLTRIERLGLGAHSAQDVIDEVNKLMTAVTLILGFFSGIALVVGALMVVNTMIISVYERTKEIGLTKALGASDYDIMKMFLAECLIIGIIGGVFGDLLGIGFSMLIDIVGKPFLVSALGSDLGAGLQSGSITVITPWMLAAGFAISLILSIVSGLYPARRAARLNPLDALRQI